MALIHRITRLFRADMHAVLDRIEEPDSLLRQAVREMEEEIARQEQRLKLLNHEGGRLDKQLTDIDPALAQLNEELAICFEAGKDDLARTLIRRKLETQAWHKQLARKRAALAEDSVTLQQQLKEQRNRCEAMRQKRDLLVGNKPDSGDTGYNAAPDFGVSDEDVEVAFLREKQQRRSA